MKTLIILLTTSLFILFIDFLACSSIRMQATQKLWAAVSIYNKATTLYYRGINADSIKADADAIVTEANSDIVFADKLDILVIVGLREKGESVKF